VKAGRVFANSTPLGYNNLQQGRGPASPPEQGKPMQVVEMRLAEIRSDDVHSISFPSHPERYEGLQDRFPGLPLLIIDDEKRVVCGHDYLLLLRRRGRLGVPVLRLGLIPAESLLLNYNILDRLFGLNLYEKLLFIKKISPLIPAKKIQRLVELGFPLDEPLFQRLDLLLREPFRSCLAAGRLGLKTALKMAEQEETDRLAQLHVFQACGFSESQQQQMVQMLEEIAFREKKPIAAVLAASGLPDLLKGEMPQKKVMEALSGMRYPVFSRMEKEWQAWQKKMAATSGLSLHHAPFFSRKEVQVTLTVKDRSAAEKLLLRLKKSSKH
jgi:hypothetical protein